MKLRRFMHRRRGIGGALTLGLMVTALSFVFWFVNVFPKYRARFETWHAGGFKSEDQLTLGWLFLFTLAGIGLWVAYKLFMFFCARLDDQGHWDRRIADREHHWF